MIAPVGEGATWHAYATPRLGAFAWNPFPLVGSGNRYMARQYHVQRSEVLSLHGMRFFGFEFFASFADTLPAS
jgi:hypothetical protein